MNPKKTHVTCFKSLVFLIQSGSVWFLHLKAVSVCPTSLLFDQFFFFLPNRSESSMAALLSFSSSSPPRILHKQSKSILVPPDSTLFTPLFFPFVGELSAKPISVSRRFRVAINSTTVSDSSGNVKPPSSPAKKLREIMKSPGVLQGPCCFDALSAKLIERAGFLYCITTGNDV